MSVLLVNIAQLHQAGEEFPPFRSGKSMMNINSIEDAFILIEDELIKDYGKVSEMNCRYLTDADEMIDLGGKHVMPAFCDPHTHIVYAGSREIEYSDKIRGLSYEEIAARGGGILNSSKLLHNTSEDELFEQSAKRIREVMYLGTGAIEIKSGYGLNTKDELKMLRVIKRIKEEFPILVKSTFLGAHSFPAEYRNARDRYVRLVVEEMIPAVAAEGLADYIDVFCDKGFFSPENTARILEAGRKYGMIPKIHANELDFSGGIQEGVKAAALSVDHLEFTGEEEIEVLRSSSTMPTLLPGASFFLGMPDAPARKIIDAGLPLALASDYNPGSSPSGNMKFIMSLGCIRLRMLPEEALNAVTLNAAYAMGVEKEAGTISRGKLANLIITHKIPSLAFLPYAYGSDLISSVYIRGRKIRG